MAETPDVLHPGVLDSDQPGFGDGAGEGGADFKKPRNNNPGVRVQGGRVYDSDNGTTCHQCRQKTAEGKAKCGKCTLWWCPACLLNRYGERVAEVDLVLGWPCPRCRGDCNCSNCRKKRGLEATGILADLSRAGGFASVSALLEVSPNAKRPRPPSGDENIAPLDGLPTPKKQKSKHGAAAAAAATAVLAKDKPLAEAAAGGVQAKPPRKRSKKKAAIDAEAPTAADTAVRNGARATDGGSGAALGAQAADPAGTAPATEKELLSVQKAQLPPVCVSREESALGSPPAPMPVAAEVAVRAATVRRSRQAPWISALPESTILPEACAAGDLACALEFLHVFSGALGIDSRQLATFAAELLQPPVVPRRQPITSEATSVVAPVLAAVLRLVRQAGGNSGSGGGGGGQEPWSAAMERYLAEPSRVSSAEQQRPISEGAGEGSDPVAAPTYSSKQRGFWGETPAVRLFMLLRLCHRALDTPVMRELVEAAVEKSAVEELKQRKVLSEARKEVKAVLAGTREREVQRLLTQQAVKPKVAARDAKVLAAAKGAVKKASRALDATLAADTPPVRTTALGMDRSGAAYWALHCGPILAEGPCLLVEHDVGQAEGGPQHTEWGAHIHVDEVARALDERGLSEGPLRTRLAATFNVKLERTPGAVEEEDRIRRARGEAAAAKALARVQQQALARPQSADGVDAVSGAAPSGWIATVMPSKKVAKQSGVVLPAPVGGAAAATVKQAAIRKVPSKGRSPAGRAVVKSPSKPSPSAAKVTAETPDRKTLAKPSSKSSSTVAMSVAGGKAAAKGRTTEGKPVKAAASAAVPLVKPERQRTPSDAKRINAGSPAVTKVQRYAAVANL